MHHGYTYASALAASEKVHWRVEDLIGGDKRLDFSRPFMPESLARAGKLPFLAPDEQRTLNQIRGYGYLCVFGIVEEFIVPFVLDHARPQLSSDDHRVRALLQFAAEEAKHIHLFNRFREEFEHDFGSECGVIGPAEAIGREVLARHPLAVALVILQIEWMTQAHYLECVRDDQDLDPLFKDLLKHHWMEEAQHAKLDTLMVEALAASLSPSEVERALEDYLAIAGFLDAGLGQQVEFDLESLERATGRQLSEAQRADFLAVQRQATRWTYLGSGLQHPSFLKTLGGVSAPMRAKVEEMTPAFS